MISPYWTISRPRHIAAYLIALRGKGTELPQAVHSLHLGIPDDARKLQDKPETWEWLEVRHWITFVVDRNKQCLYITDVESATIK